MTGKDTTKEAPAPKAAPRTEYTLKAPADHPEGQALLIQGGKEKFAGDKVLLRADQAEKLGKLGIL